jgi:translation initiation factor IF-2
MPDKNSNKTIETKRPPVVAIMGHIDHGKSTLLDYIRKTNLVEKEASGITQRIGAYEVLQKTKDGREQKITFLDTPGHEAFNAIRRRGANAADIAILVVSAEDGVKPQTIEALKSIKESGLPFIVAVTKIDKPEANVERAKQSLAENEIYLEGCGGDIPFMPVSGKTGEGVSELLDLIVLMGELKEIAGNPAANGSGIVIEADLDRAKGIAATVIVKNGTLKRGRTALAEDALSPVRIIENFAGKKIDSATMSEPVRIIGWSKMPRVGANFETYDDKREAEIKAAGFSEIKLKKPKLESKTAGGDCPVIPVVIKADVLGTIEAIEHELEKIKNERVLIQIIQTGVGDIGETDVKNTAGKKGSVIVGFNVRVDSRAKTIAERSGATVITFDIIYKLTEWFEKLVAERTPKLMVEETKCQAKIIKTFSKEKDKQVVGGRVLEGVLSLGDEVNIKRRDTEIGKGRVKELQKLKLKVSEVQKDNEFGVLIQSPVPIAAGDIIQSFTMIEK